MEIQKSLFEGELIRLAPIDPEKDAEIESRWTHNAQYMRMLSPDPMRPLAPHQIKKKYEAIEKEVDENRGLFYFTIRKREEKSNEQGEGVQEERLVGFARIFWIEWNNGAAAMQLGIGDPNDWRQGYGSDALRLLLRFAFCELNLFRLSAVVPEYNTAALRLFHKAGFVEEVRRREALQRDGRRWDLVHLGILQEEWQNGRLNQ
jgi:RimJ/RimL family protein N-acetyltransferase